MWIGSERATHRPINSPFKNKAIILSSFILIIFATIFLINQNPFLDSPSEITPLQNPENSHSEIISVQPPQQLPQKLPIFYTQLNPFLYHSNGTEIIYQIPDSPKAVLFAAHGCQIHAYDFWDKSPNCPHCTGLPEDRLFVLQALELNFAVITISSLGECWSFGKEMENIEWIIQNWVETNKLEKLPKLGFGASSGGYFISSLANKIKFSSICIMIAEGVFETMDIPQNYPPTLFVHMVKDIIRVSAIKTNMAELTEKGIETKEIGCVDFPLDPNFLANRVPGLNLNFVVKLIEVFREKGFLDEKGYLRKDGRAIKWREVLTKKKLIDEKFELFRHVNEELNLAFGFHEFTSLKNKEIFEWFESHLKTN